MMARIVGGPTIGPPWNRRVAYSTLQIDGAGATVAFRSPADNRSTNASRWSVFAFDARGPPQRHGFLLEHVGASRAVGGLDVAAHYLHQQP